MSNSISVPVSIKCKQKNKNVETLGLIDCGAGGQFIDQNYVKKMGFSYYPWTNHWRPLTWMEQKTNEDE
jgi:hypothetical protein